MPQLTAGWEDKAAALTPEEGFLLSRIDGTTPWDSLRTRSPACPAERGRRLPRTLAARRVDSARRQTQTSSCAGSSRRELCIDAALGLPIDMQERAIQVESLIAGNYHDLLGVGRATPTPRRSSAATSSSPGLPPRSLLRQGRGSLRGPARPHLQADRLGLRAADGSDDPRRARALDERSAPVSTARGPAADGQPQKFSKREWLARMRKQFRLPEEVLAERRLGAKQLAGVGAGGGAPAQLDRRPPPASGWPSPSTRGTTSLQGAVRRGSRSRSTAFAPRSCCARRVVRGIRNRSPRR